MKHLRDYYNHKYTKKERIEMKENSTKKSRGGFLAGVKYDRDGKSQSFSPERYPAGCDFVYDKKTMLIVSAPITNTMVADKTLRAMSEAFPEKCYGIVRVTVNKEKSIAREGFIVLNIKVDKIFVVNPELCIENNPDIFKKEMFSKDWEWEYFGNP